MPPAQQRTHIIAVLDKLSRQIDLLDGMNIGHETDFNWKNDMDGLVEALVKSSDA